MARRVSAADRRAREVRLTDEGTALLERVLPIVQAAQTRFLSGLDEGERETFIALLQKATLAANDLSRAPQRDLPGSQAAE